jgi:hypothetical protein
MAGNAFLGQHLPEFLPLSIFHQSGVVNYNIAHDKIGGYADYPGQLFVFSMKFFQ